MATTAQKSPFMTNYTASPRVLNTAQGVVKILDSGLFTQSGDGDAGSTIDLVRIPGGATLLTMLSTIAFSDYGTGITLDIGWAAYTTPAGTAVVADPDGLVQDIDVATAASLGQLLSRGTAIGAAGLTKTFEAEALIQATVVGGAIPDLATLRVMLAYV